MDHARPGNLQPTAMLADPTPLPLAENAIDINLNGRLREGEIGPANTELPLASVELLRELR